MTVPSSLRATALIALAAVASACGSVPGNRTATGVVKAVGAESQYANVLGQIGGRYVQVFSILANPNTDPHTFESSPRVASEVAGAALVVQNGLGYDGFMNKIEDASPSPTRRVIVAQSLLGLPNSTRNPHLWYDPKTMPAVAAAIAGALSSLLPAHTAYFRAKASSFDRSLQPWLAAIAAFKASHAGTPVATTEPVADYLLQAMGTDNLTPFGLQADIMNGLDPAPEDVALENRLFASHRVRVLCYNQQVVDPLTTGLRDNAQAAGIPVVGVYETMPTPGYDYQTWMLAETRAIARAVVDRVSTERL